MTSKETLEAMAEKCRAAGMTVDVDCPDEPGIPSITVTRENGSMRVFHVPTSVAPFSDVLAVERVSAMEGKILDAPRSTIFDYFEQFGEPYVPGDRLMLDFKSPGGEMAGRADLKAWLRKDARRGRAKRYSRFPAWRYRASWRAW